MANANMYGAAQKWLWFMRQGENQVNGDAQMRRMNCIQNERTTRSTAVAGKVVIIPGVDRYSTFREKT